MMQGLGADGAGIIGGVAVDLGIAAFKISAAILKQLLLLHLEGKGIKSGETNINKLLKRIDEGDRTASITLQKEHIGQIAETAKRHGVLYAIAETAKGEFVVYYPESQNDRMKNVLNEILDDRRGIKSPEWNDLGRDGNQTEVIFDAAHPENYIEIRQSQEGAEKSCSIYIHREGNEPIRSNSQLAANILKQFEEPQSFDVRGHYPTEKLEAQVGRQAKAFQAEKTALKEFKTREAAVKTLLKDNASLEGTVHFFVDSQNPNNRIAIQKILKTEKGAAYTETRTAVYLDGRHVMMDPADALQEFSRYKRFEQHGKAALNEFEKMDSSGELDWSSKEKGEEKKPLDAYLRNMEKGKPEKQAAPHRNQKEKTRTQRER